MTVSETMKRIRAMGMTVRYRDREWRVNYPKPKGTEETAYYTPDADDAIDTAKAMSEGGVKLAERADRDPG